MRHALHKSFPCLANTRTSGKWSGITLCCRHPGRVQKGHFWDVLGKSWWPGPTASLHRWGRGGGNKFPSSWHEGWNTGEMPITAAKVAALLILPKQGIRHIFHQDSTPYARPPFPLVSPAISSGPFIVYSTRGITQPRANSHFTDWWSAPWAICLFT